MNPIVLIAASEGGLHPVRQIVAALPIPCTAAVFVVQHIGAHPSILPSILASACGLPSLHPRDGDLIKAGRIYVAPPDHHMVLGYGVIGLNRQPRVHYSRPAADPLFLPAARVYGSRTIGIVLTGGGHDAAIGLRAIKAHGGLALVQRPETAVAPGMPRSAIAAEQPDAILTISEIADRIGALCSSHETPTVNLHHQDL